MRLKFLAQRFSSWSGTGLVSQNQMCTDTFEQSKTPALEESCQWYEVEWNSGGSW